MARTPANFLEVLWDLARMQGLEPDEEIEGGGLTDVQKATLLSDFNRGYRKAYDWQGTAWEDAWKSGELTPVDGVVSYAQIEDASVFTLWTADPRPDGACAGAVSYRSSDAGLHVQTSEATVYAFWKPACPKFTDADDAEATVLAVLAPAALDLARAAGLSRDGQHGAARVMTAEGESRLEDQAALEFPRLQTWWWIRRNNNQ